MKATSAALGVGALASVIAALPALPRVTAEGTSALVALVLLSGGTALVLGPALVLAAAPRGESQGLRAALYGFALAAAPLAVLANALKSGTNHRPLGAATYAVLALVMILLSVLLAWRLLRFAHAGSTIPSRAVRVLLTVGALASTAFVIVRALGAPNLVPHVLDGLRALATAALGYLLLRLPRTAALLGRAGGPLWVAVVVAGLVAAQGVARAAVRSGAPVLGGPVTWF
ncbi:MAG TPA: hypothetical protein VFZ53_14660 [Polyangiaceae bacterium]